MLIVSRGKHENESEMKGKAQETPEPASLFSGSVPYLHHRLFTKHRAQAEFQINI